MSPPILSSETRTWIQFIVKSREETPWGWFQVVVPLFPIVAGALYLISKGALNSVTEFVAEGDLLLFAALLSFGVFMELEFASRLADRLQVEVGLTNLRWRALAIAFMLMILYGGSLWNVGLPSATAENTSASQVVESTEDNSREQLIWAIVSLLSCLGAIGASVGGMKDCSRALRSIQDL